MFAIQICCIIVGLLLIIFCFFDDKNGGKEATIGGMLFGGGLLGPFGYSRIFFYVIEEFEFLEEREKKDLKFDFFIIERFLFNSVNLILSFAHIGILPDFYLIAFD